MSKEIKIDNKNKNVEDFVKKYAPNGYYFMKCGCGIFTTNYPFISECCKCGFKYAGSSEDIEKWKRKEILIELLNLEEVSAKKRTELINESIYNEDHFDEDLYDEEDYNDIMGF